MSFGVQNILIVSFEKYARPVEFHYRKTNGRFKFYTIPFNSLRLAAGRFIGN